MALAVPERAAVDAAKELGYDSSKDLQLAGIQDSFSTISKV